MTVITASALLCQQIPVDTFPMAAKATPDGKFLLVLNAGVHPPSISVIDIAAAKELNRTPVPDAWLGLTMNKAGDRVYVGGASRSAVYEFTLTQGVLKPARMFAAGDFVGDVQLAPDGHLLYAAALYKDTVIVINPQSGLVLSRIKTGRRPYRILFHPSGKRLYVSSWADGSVGAYDPNNGERLATMRVGPHTTDMAWSEGPVEDQPSLTARLFVSAGNTNSVYVLGADEAGELSRLESVSLAATATEALGITPGGLGLSADRKRLFVACSGIDSAAVLDISGPHAFVEGFLPAGAYPTSAFGLPDGRVGVLSGHAGSVRFANLSEERPRAATPDRADAPYGGPVKHVIYIVGDLGQGQNGATAGIVPDYTERLWPSHAGGRRTTNDFEGQEPANQPPAGYIWTAANQAGLSMRNYGFFVDNRKEPEADGTQITGIRDPILAPITDPNYRGPDPNYPDSGRAKEFLSELADFEKAGDMPRLLLMRMGDEKAIGVVRDAVMKSKFGKETAVFVPSAANQLNVLHTVEIILGLHPMTLFDAAATPVF
ncbi:MAG: YncE family protein [Acidobacteriota bacterium]|nr:YncE family protein [Acidobacteriota bacterium]